MWALCALLLSGCESLNELKAKFWPFDSDQGTSEATAESGGGSEPITGAANEEVALDTALVTKVQTKLTEFGYDPGPVDGRIGPKTRAAIRRYQVVEGLPVDGRITQPVLVRLTGTSAAEAPQAAPRADAEAGTGDARAAENALGPVPAYEAGSRYVYADGEVRTVLSVDGEQVYWQSSKDGHAVGRSNFLIPNLSWVSAETSGKRTLGEVSGDLWPQNGDQEVTFSTTGMVEHKTRPDSGSQLSETWRCRLGGEKQLTVRAGTFLTRQITCDGQSETDGTSRQRTWYYAPEIGHYVLYEETDGSQQSPRRSELLAIVPSTVDWPPVARAGLGWALEHALETATAGERTTWTSSAVDIEVTIEPGATVAMGDHETCRNFVQIWSRPGSQQIYPGLSCREPSGQWLIPGFEAGVALAKGAE